jgi:hypothetical protein
MRRSYYGNSKRKRLVQALFFATLSNLIFIRIVSRFGMHFSTQIRKAPLIIFSFRLILFLGSIISYISMGLLIIALLSISYQKMRSNKRLDIVISFLLLSLITTSILSYIMSSNVVVSLINDLVSVTLISLFSSTSLFILKKRSEKAMAILVGLAYICFFYFKVSQGLFVVIERIGPPPFVLEMIGMGELFIVLSIIPLFFAYSDISSQGISTLFSKGNISILILPSLLSLIFFIAGLINPYALAIVGTWSLGLTLYLPAPVYILALWLFTYTITRSLVEGKSVGYAIGLIYFSGFSLSLFLELLTLIFALSMINTGEI